MKKRILSLLLVFVMCLTMLPTSSLAAGKVALKISAANASPSKGDTVTFSVAVGEVKNLTNMEFVIDVPEGLTYVEKSAKLADGLKETLMVAAADWTETTKKFTMYGDSAYTSATDTLIMTFDCKVNDDASGTLSVSVRDDLSISDIEYEEMDVTVVPAIITIGGVTPPAHTHDLKKVDAKDATCTEDGNIEYYQCSDSTCGKLYKDAAGTQEITLADTVIKAAHTGIKLYPAKAPTCTDDGCIAYWFCTGCDNYYFDNDGAVGAETTVEKVAISATGHKWELVVKEVEGATTHTKECKVCGKTEEETHDKWPGDEPIEWTSNDDYHWHQFACGTIMDKAAHTWNAGVETTPATCTKAGEKTLTCTVCGHEKIVTIPKADHQYKWTNDETNHWQECTVCGDIIDKAEHTYASHKCEDTATCTKAECGYVKAAGVHAWGTAEYKWGDDNMSCTATVKCTNCEAVETDVAFIGISTTPATCTVDGKTVYTATFSSELFTTQIKEVTIDKLGHTYGAPVWSWSEDGKTATATFTCTREGCTAETTGHAQTVTATVSGKQNVAPTCTDKGTTTYTAKVTFEKKDYTDTKDVQDINALGHKLTKTPAKAETCETAGNKEYYTCGTCGKFFSDKDGKNEIAKDSWVIAALGHKMTKTPAKAATCMAEGNNEYYTCSVCNKVFKDEQGTKPTTVRDETLAKNPENHTGGKELRGAVAASCMTAGRTADTYCKGCGVRLSVGAFTPPTGNHNYVNGVCTTCGNKQPANGDTIKAAIEKVVADAKEAVEEALDKAIENETNANTKEILKKLKSYVSGSSKLQAVYNVTMTKGEKGDTPLANGETLADAQNVTIAISKETYNALKSGAKIVESYLDKDGKAQTREINATLKQVGDGYTVTFAADKTAVYGLMTRTSSGGSSSGSSYTSGQSFTTDLPADSINRVTVNGKKLDSKYYTVSSNGSGSIVTLTDAYLATLKAGKYTVKIENKTHVSTGTFTIKADGTLSSPRTADAGIALYAVMAVSSLMGTAVVSKKRRKA